MADDARPEDATPEQGVASSSAPGEESQAPRHTPQSDAARTHAGGDLQPPSAPPAAWEVYGDRVGLAERYVAELAGTGVAHGLIGPREVPRLWERHVLNCAVVAELVPEGVTVVDIGSGAGLPGLALAIARPELTLDLVEPLQRRTDWLAAVAAELGLDNVRVHHARAQDVVGQVLADVGTARAVTSIGRLASWCAPLVRPGGEILAIKGQRVREELASDERQLRRAGVESVDVVECGGGMVEPPTTVARLHLSARRPDMVTGQDGGLRRGRAGKGRRR